MSNRFVSGGTIGPPGDQAIPQDDSRPARPHMADTTTEWAAVQQELENARKARAEQRVKAASGEERSLYDVLQANKAAKQAAFEEQNRIKNQFRALDEDEIDFLDEVKAAKRMEEERVRREMEDGLRAFREQQRRSSGGGEGAEGSGGLVDQTAGEWSAGRKRKRGRGREKEKMVLVKRKAGEDEKRKSDGDDADEEGGTAAESGEERKKTEVVDDGGVGSIPRGTVGTGSKLKSVGLVSYGSDDSNDE
ncbi:hypothetical protein EsDP_00002965 [Epichloe bromicola]|uniref:FAM192A/Fyv6 N-terminal domain-containing protein n=1 Tax=Epichloe bromicola TaxID=79588 RepID=A0ABQ0CMC2_9HYPO